MESVGCGILIKKLCSHITGISDAGRLEAYYELAVRQLMDGLSLPVDDNCTIIEDKIRRKLAREYKLEDAARFSSLLKKLHHSTILKRKAAILLLLFILSKRKSTTPNSSNSCIFSETKEPINAAVNGFDDELFPLPPLYPIGSRQSSTGPNSSGTTSTTEDGICTSSLYCGSRVAQLAALYKGGDRIRKSSTISESDGGQVDALQNKFSKKNYDRKHMCSSSSLIEVSEDLLLRDILFIFQGIEGKVIKIDSCKDIFKIDPKVRLSPSTRDLLLRLAEIGWLYNEVKSFCESHGRPSVEHVEGAGLINQSLVLSLKDELNEYCRLIAVLEAQVHENGADTPLEGSGGLSLRRLLLWTLEPRARLRTLLLLTHAVKNVRGGTAVSALYEHMHHGDPSHVMVVHRALLQACTPLFVMLTNWLLDGFLEDPHHEFFIAADPTVQDERLWHDKYTIRWSMLPCFIRASQAQKILVTGKSLNFLVSVCRLKVPLVDRESLKKAAKQTTVESLFSQDENDQLDHLINLTFMETSHHVLEEILTRHKLLEHLRALRRYLLLGQGDFIHYLMEILGPELCKPAVNMFTHNLTSLLETAVASSNAQFEDPDVLKRLHVRMLKTNIGDTGWDVFCLDYHVDGPIGTVFTPKCMQNYLKLFKSLWMAKRMGEILSSTWKQQAATSKLCRDLPELAGVLHRIQLLLSEMIHLVQEMAYYTTFEVLECSWHIFMAELQCAKSLDEVIAGHDKFLNRIIAGTLLDDSSREVSHRLLSVYDSIVRLECLQERLYSAVILEVTRRRSFDADLKDSSLTTSFINEETEKKKREEFSTKFVPNMKAEINCLIQTYDDMFEVFLLKLTQHEDDNLRLLCSRLDFNEYYQRKDHRLNQRLTFHHKRKSMGGHFQE